jgi:D-alanyl-lipoteichoic acid acyltransferase DltB (MBOAT superfamily)
MLFNSFGFLLFFPVVTLLYFLSPYRLRWMLLLAASCFFYMAFVPVYILILFSLITIDYFSGILIEQAAAASKKAWLVLSIAANLGILAFFKYFSFFSGYIPGAAAAIILPVGLSFHTFQAMSYTLEVYRGNHKAERHYGIYALYVMFYPQLVAGPIERPQNMLHQFREKHPFSYDNAVSGLRLMLMGFFKKIVIADTIATVIDPVYNHPRNYDPLSVVIAVAFFAYEIYCDFSGYSDIAVGAARVMGYKLMINFDHPFRSKSITEFWRRWHISLSTWFYDYVFNPIIIRLRDWGRAGIVAGLFITFFLSGLWHGSGWQFAIYGLLHGIALVYEYLTKKTRKKLFSRLPVTVSNVVSKVITISYAAFTWIFFRATSLSDAVYITKQLPCGALNLFKVKNYGAHTISNLLEGSGYIRLLYCVLLIALLEVFHAAEGKDNKESFLGRHSRFFRWSVYVLLLFSIVLLGTFNHKQFIYFQF